MGEQYTGVGATYDSMTGLMDRMTFFGDVNEYRKRRVQCHIVLVQLSRLMQVMVVTVAEVADITNMEATLATRPAHEAITNQVEALMRAQGVETYTLSTEACAICESCAYPHAPCRCPDKMHPCIESHGIVLTQTAESCGIPFQYGENVVTWFSLIFWR